MTPRHFSELDPRRRRRAVVRTVVAVMLVWTVLISVYYVLPVGDYSGVGALLRLGIGLALVVLVLARQIRRTLHAEVPELRAVEALCVVIPLFLVVLATIYLSLSHAAASSFTQPLDHTRALYFAVSVFSTVGFGDITPSTDPARLFVSIQMVLDLLIIGILVRTVFNAAKTGLNHTHQDPSDQTNHPAIPSWLQQSDRLEATEVGNRAPYSHCRV